MKRTLSAEQKQKSEERRARLRGLAKQISGMGAAERADLAARCPVMTIEGRVLSQFNQCMVAMQNPTATICGGFRQWIKAGRAVRKGEHGAAIWIPTGKTQDATTPNEPTAEDTEGQSVRFILGTVFDVTQTDEIADEQAEEIAA
jgi:hypothetical protein